jgi:hypothetical protein
MSSTESFLDGPGPRDFHLRARADAEDEVPSRLVAGLAIVLLLLLTGAYVLFAWQSDRPALAGEAQTIAASAP